MKNSRRIEKSALAEYHQYLSITGEMKTRMLFPLALVFFVALASENANAGAAVAIGEHDQLAAAYGGPIKREEQRALAQARRKYGPNKVRLLAATDVTGYGAIAVARRPGGWLVGIALGRRSATEADTLAIEQCRKAGGIKPRVRWGFFG